MFAFISISTRVGVLYGVWYRLTKKQRPEGYFLISNVFPSTKSTKTTTPNINLSKVFDKLLQHIYNIVKYQID